MPERKTTPRLTPAVDAEKLADFFRWACDDTFTEDFFGERQFRSPAEARKAWPRARRAVWGQCHRMRVPDAARVFDGLTSDSWQFIWHHYADEGPFPAAKAEQLIDHDRATLDAFARRDGRGAAEILGFLSQWRNDLDTLAQIAEELGAWDGPWWRRPIPVRRMTSGRRYGDGGDAA